MNKKLSKLVAGIALGLLIGGIIELSGCKSTLESGGAYAPTNSVAGAPAPAPDQTFYNIELGYDLAWSTVNAVFDFERNNRLYLWGLDPNIKHTLDQIRPQALAADKEYLAARAAYMANPTPGGLSALQTALGRLQQFTSAAQAATATVQSSK